MIAPGVADQAEWETLANLGSFAEVLKVIVLLGGLSLTSRSGRGTGVLQVQAGDSFRLAGLRITFGNSREGALAR